MGPYEHILVGLDLGPRGDALSSGSRLALDQARVLASWLDSRVTLIHSSAADEHWDTENGSYRYLGQGTSPLGSRVLDRVLESLRADGFKVELVRSEERAWIAIVREALRRQNELVVVGKRSEESADGRRLGSVSLKLLRHCPSPVWAVRTGARLEPATIVAATDLSQIGDAVVQTAGFLAQHWQAQCHVVDALQLPLSVQLEGISGETQYVREHQASAREEILRQLGPELSPDRIHVHVGLDAPTHAIVATVERYAADLLVMGTVARGGLAGLVVGNTAERLLGRVECSLLTLKPADFECAIRP